MKDDSKKIISYIILMIMVYITYMYVINDTGVREYCMYRDPGYNNLTNGHYWMQGDKCCTNVPYYIEEDCAPFEKLITGADKCAPGFINDPVCWGVE